MTHIPFLRIMMEDAVLTHYSPISKIDGPRILELLQKSDTEIAAILANPKEDISWYEPFAGHMEDPEVYALIKEVMSAD